MSQTSLHNLEKLWKLAIVAFSSGAIVMALEIAGSRIITPVFGSTTYSWGILIGVVLSGLTIGYHLGGRITAFSPSFAKLCSIVFSMGIFILLIPFMSEEIIGFFTQFSPSSISANLFVTLALFCPPSILAGFVSPYAIKLGTGTLQKVGNISGNLYSLATLGSIFGTFFTVFVLIPFFEIDHIIIGLGISLMLVSVIGLKAIPKIILGLIVLLLALNYTFSEADLALPDGVLFEKESTYSNIRVTEEGDFRTLYVDGIVHSTMDMRFPNQLDLHYTKFFHIAKINPNLESVLFVGGGGFSGPKSFLAEYPGIKVDVVEIDPEIVSAAKRYFFIPDDPDLATHTEDARQYLTQNQKRYDAIILDAYSGNTVPFHLLTLEYYQLLSSRLNSGGVIVSNFIGSLEGSNAQLFNANYKTMKEVFPAVYAFPVNVDNVDYRQNISVVALKGENQRSHLFENDADCVVYDDLTCGDLVENQFIPTVTDETPVLTDQFSPVDHLSGYYIQSPTNPQFWNSAEVFAENLLFKAGMAALIIVWLLAIRKIWKEGLERPRQASTLV